MTDKERLEEAKLMAKMLRVETRLPHDFPFDLVDWLIEQSERVQDLKIMLKVLGDRNQRYKHALKFGVKYLQNSNIRQIQLVVSALKNALEETE